MPLMGEMITLYGSMVWLPTDGNNTPDFLTPLDPDSDVAVYTGFNVTLDGPFNEYFTLETSRPDGMLRMFWGRSGRPRRLPRRPWRS